MTLVGLAARNLLRNQFRSALTVIGVSVAVIAFLLLRTVLWAWTAGANYAAKDRVVTRNKITFIIPLPLRYVEDIRQVAGIKYATYANWFGGKDPRHEHEFFGSMAVDGKTFFQVYDDIVVPDDAKQRWMEDRRGAIVGDVLARKLGWKVGDRVTLAGTIFPGDWQFTVDGIYTVTSKAIDRSSFFFHWAYLNDSIPQRAKDKAGWVVARIDDPLHSADISQAIDKIFDIRDVQTVSQSERAFNTSFLGMISALLVAIDIISVVILAIMALILGNTIAMGVRERTAEYGVLRAIGFLPRHLGLLILAEGMTTGLVGGGIGLALGYPLVSQGVGRWLEENMGQFFPFFQVNPATALAALALAVGLGVAAAMAPAYRVFRIDVISALRRVG